jgi:hypothetical protein
MSILCSEMADQAGTDFIIFGWLFGGAYNSNRFRSLFAKSQALKYFIIP